MLWTSRSFSKDAFRSFDVGHVGGILFAQLCKLLNWACQMAKEPRPAFSIMKDMIKAIDISGMTFSMRRNEFRRSDNSTRLNLQ
jgi:hypothetical protein